MKKPGGQAAFAPDVEEYLIQYINICSEWGYPLETIDFRLLIKGYLENLGLEIKRFKNNMPGPDYIKSFLKRHKLTITSRLSKNIKRSRAAVSPEVIKAYFDELEISLQGIPLGNIVNYDETNLVDDPGRKRVLVKRSVKYPERIMNHTKVSTSIMMAAAANGTLLPPFVVYKAQHVYDTWRQNGPKGSRYNSTSSGWFDGFTFEDWVRTIVFDYFEDKTGTKILIGDNLASHLSIEIIKECETHRLPNIHPEARNENFKDSIDQTVLSMLKEMRSVENVILREESEKLYKTNESCDDESNTEEILDNNLNILERTGLSNVRKADKTENEKAPSQELKK
ncbi:uncharacterized protein LOC114252110 [Bombyx mandarina]|uniref:Uncharacterized protein LOC114252110 n=1 Tax=Bombyx mandarina TaxID=7092 RepID=A0A6J2KJY6_BOMMA|nr:uncharacterized protein LOC114252110 [Bombyx mandarina]